MPVWQQFYSRHQGEDVEILSVAMDAQGPGKARPYVEKARCAFTTVVDEENRLGQLYGFKAIPNGFLLDETGVVRYKKLGGFDIRHADTAEIVERWHGGSDLRQSSDGDATEVGVAHAQANARFRLGLALYQAGDIQGAVVEWRKGVELEPDNYIIRKQIWAVENPKKFYAGDVDYDWQREQLASGH